MGIRTLLITFAGSALLLFACTPDEETRDSGGKKKSDAATGPDHASFDTATADILVADTATPDTALPDATTPDATTPDAVTADAVEPDVSLPDTLVVDTAVEDAGPPPNTAPTWPITAAMTTSYIGRLSVGLTWDAAEDDYGLANYLIYQDDVLVQTLPGDQTATRVFGLTATTAFTFAVNAVDLGGLETASRLTVTLTTGDLPPEPVSVAPPPIPANTNLFQENHAFLYSGDDPIQVGADPAAFELHRFAIARGCIKQPDGSALPGVTVTVHNHPEHGETTSRVNGCYDLAVNGGSRVTLDFRLTGYLRSQRSVHIPWENAVVIDDIILVPMDTQSTLVDLTAPTDTQVARGSMVSDSDGQRRATVLFPPTTSASMRLSDGSTASLSTLTVRATEYTVGTAGPSMMPAELPPTTSYTYAMELSVDEAEAAGATSVEFDEPLPVYVDNFLGFPAGTAVPVGLYDREQAQWIPEDNGLVIDIVGEAANEAQIDMTGDGQANDAVQLATIGINQEELTQLASLYDPPHSLWRVAVSHFSARDLNWYNVPDNPNARPPWGRTGGGGPGQGSTDPNSPDYDPTAPGKPRHPDGQPDDGKPQTKDCDDKMSIVGCNSQSLGQALAIVGTPFRLAYKSTRMSGDKRDRTLDIPLTGAEVPPDVQKVAYSLELGGSKITEELDPEPNLSVRVTWDGVSRITGAGVQGSVPWNITGSYGYQASYRPPADVQQAFAAFPDPSWFNFAVPSRQLAYLGSRYQGVFDAKNQQHTKQLGGWTLDIHHALDRSNNMLYLGSGQRRETQSLGAVLGHAVGMWPILTACTRQTESNFYEGMPATTLRKSAPYDVATMADGSVIISDTCAQRVLRLSVDGLLTTFAGGGSSEEENIPAVSATYRHTRDLAVGPDGSVFLYETNSIDFARVRKVTPDGLINTVVGNGTVGNDGDEGPAIDATIDRDCRITVATDGSLYLSQRHLQTIRRVTPDGFIHTIAGQGSGSDGGPALTAAIDTPTGIDVDTDGNIFFCQARRIRKINTDGIIQTVVGNGSSGSPVSGQLGTQTSLRNPHDVTVGEDGILYFVADEFSIFYVNQQGIVNKLGGDPTTWENEQEGILAYSGYLGGVRQISIGPNHIMYAARTDSHIVRRIDANEVRRGYTPEVNIPNETGTQYFTFDRSGRHLATYNAFTHRALYVFGYQDGLLVSVTDADGEVTSIERQSDGTPLAIVSPAGLRTELIIDTEFITSIQYPSGTQYDFSYSSDGLMQSMIDSEGDVHQYVYDDLGRLVEGTDGRGRWLTLSREITATGSLVTKTISQDGVANNIVTTYLVDYQDDGTTRYINTDPSGAQTERVESPDGSVSYLFAEGTVARLDREPDLTMERGGPFVNQLQIITPGGLRSTTSYTRDVTWNQDASPKPTNVTLTRVENGYQSTTEHDLVNRTVTRTTFEGNVSIATYNETGDLLSLQADPNYDSRTWSYDTQGRLTRSDNGINPIDYSYSEMSQTLTMTDGLNRQTIHSFDSQGQRDGTTFASGAQWSFGYDHRGRRNTFVPASGAQHSVTYDDRGQIATYTLPDATVLWQRTFGLDYTTLAQDWTQRSMAYSYDPGNRLTSIDYNSATVTHQYADNTERISSFDWSQKNSSAQQSVAITYDGDVTKSISFTGDAEGTFDTTHNNRLLPTQISATIGSATTATDFIYNGSQRLTGYGPFTLTRDGPAGSVSEISDGAFVQTYSYNSGGQLSEKTITISGALRYSLSLTYDVVGRVETRTVVVDGATQVSSYSYDDDDQLIGVSRENTSVEAYSYDPNGNRTGQAYGGSVTATGTYAEDDTIIRLDNVDFGYDVDGFLVSRGGETFEYSARGELLSVTLSGGSVIRYTYDAMRRRTARTEGSGTTQHLYGHPVHLHLPSHVVNPDGAVSEYFYDDEGAVFAVLADGAMHYIASDQVGTPRIVMQGTADVTKEIERDSYGRLISDSDPDWPLHIGFAGGIDDSSTGLTRFGYRDYDTTIGRWTLRDPILFRGGDLNLFRYVTNDPIRFKDPLGLWCLGFSGYVGGGGGVKACKDKEGRWVVCTESGLGFGASLDGSMSDKNPEQGTKKKIEVGVGCGPAGTGLEAVWDDCTSEWHWKNNLGIVSGDVNLTDLEASETGWILTDDVNNFDPDAKCGPAGKIVEVKCEGLGVL